VRPGPGEVLHFSEDPGITVFEPRVAPTQQVDGVYVWAVGNDRAPDFWFPRDCPRALAWVQPSSSASDVAWLGAARVHVIEYAWLRRFLDVQLWAYRLPADGFVSVGDPPSAMVSQETVMPLGPPVPVGDLSEAHRDAGIELRVVSNLWPWWDQVVTTTLGFSGWRLRNASPRPV
jgi:hypothetical protein